MMKNKVYPLQEPRDNSDGSMTNLERGENPQDEDAILSDDDESTIKASMKDSEAEEVNYHDAAGMVGPVNSHIEADNLTDEFLAGKVDLVDQMEKTVDAVHDAYEGELNDPPPTQH